MSRSARTASSNVAWNEAINDVGTSLMKPTWKITHRQLTSPVPVYTCYGWNKISLSFQLLTWWLCYGCNTETLTKLWWLPCYGRWKTLLEGFKMPLYVGNFLHLILWVSMYFCFNRKSWQAPPGAFLIKCLQMSVMDRRYWREVRGRCFCQHPN